MSFQLVIEMPTALDHKDIQETLSKIKRICRKYENVFDELDPDVEHEIMIDNFTFTIQKQ